MRDALALWSYALATLRLRPARTLAQLLAIAAALSLLASVLLFVGTSLATMTQASASKVLLDWQAPVADSAAASRLATAVAAQPGVAESMPAAVATYLGAQHTQGGTIAQAGAGSILAVPLGYLGSMRPFQLLLGSLTPNGVVLSQPLASILQAQVGDHVLLQVSGSAPPCSTVTGCPVPAGTVSVAVTGIAVFNASDLVFQPLGPNSSGPPPAPPTEVVIVPLDLFNTAILPLEPQQPSQVGGAPSGPAAVQWEVHAQVDRASLNGDPANAQVALDTRRHVVERSFPGELIIADNLSAALGVAAAQALYGEALFIFLALPGVMIALGLAYYAAAGGEVEERRQLALLRTRGATRAQLRGAALVQGALIGLGAAALGLAAAALVVGSPIVPLSVPTGSASAPLEHWSVPAGVAVGLGLLAAVGARLAAVELGSRRLVVGERARGQRQRPPLWARVYIDVLALLGAAVVFAIDRTTGLSAVVTPDSNPTLALSFYTFLAPALLWVGTTLLLVRLGRRALAAAARRFPVHERNTALWRFLVQSAGRRAGPLSRAAIVVGLLLSFGISLGLFAATYDSQAAVDAQLSLGADVVVAAPPGAALSAATQAKATSTNGVTASSPVRHTFAYVGPDLQDLFAVDAASVNSSTTLRDTYVKGGTMTQLLSGLRSQPDGVLVSAETIKDYGLSTGDLLRLRIYDEYRGAFVVVPFHVLGIVSEFPAAPHDSFLVANLDYVLQASHANGPNLLFVATSHDPHQEAALIQAAVASSGAQVRDLSQEVALTSSSLTAVDLAGISRLEESFAVLLAAVSVTLFASLTLVERRREFAVMAAMGAPLRTIGAFLWTEAAVILGVSAVLALVLGGLMALMLVAILTHVFDPPPDTLTLPGPFLAGLLGSALAGTVFAGGLALAGLRRLDLGPALREG